LIIIIAINIFAVNSAVESQMANAEAYVCYGTTQFAICSIAMLINFFCMMIVAAALVIITTEGNAVVPVTLAFTLVMLVHSFATFKHGFWVRNQANTALYAELDRPEPMRAPSQIPPVMYHQ
jgi:hypothetical protein